MKRVNKVNQNKSISPTFVNLCMVSTEQCKTQMHTEEEKNYVKEQKEKHIIQMLI